MMSTLIDSPARLLIDGSWRDAEAEAVLEVFEPATGDRMATVARASSGDVDRAVEAARRAFDDSRWSGVRRAIGDGCWPESPPESATRSRAWPAWRRSTPASRSGTRGKGS